MRGRSHASRWRAHETDPQQTRERRESKKRPGRESGTPNSRRQVKLLTPQKGEDRSELSWLLHYCFRARLLGKGGKTDPSPFGNGEDFRRTRRVRQHHARRAYCTSAMPLVEYVVDFRTATLVPWSETAPGTAFSNTSATRFLQQCCEGVNPRVTSFSVEIARSLCTMATRTRPMKTKRTHVRTDSPGQIRLSACSEGLAVLRRALRRKPRLVSVRWLHTLLRLHVHHRQRRLLQLHILCKL